MTEMQTEKITVPILSCLTLGHQIILDPMDIRIPTETTEKKFSLAEPEKGEVVEDSWLDWSARGSRTDLRLPTVCE